MFSNKSSKFILKEILFQSSCSFSGFGTCLFIYVLLNMASRDFHLGKSQKFPFQKFRSSITCTNSCAYMCWTPCNSKMLQSKVISLISNRISLLKLHFVASIVSRYCTLIEHDVSFVLSRLSNCRLLQLF